MKIKLAILENDRNYLSRLVNVFTTRYTDKLEVYSFTDEDAALNALSASRINVFLADEVFEIDPKAIPNYCGFAYLTDNSGIESIRDVRAVAKFQKTDLIYRQILSIHSENAGSDVTLYQNDDDCKVIAFVSPSGGTGASSAAAACALYLSRKGKKALYLNLEKLGASDVFFKAEGDFDFSDIIFAVKSKKTNLSLKLESCVRRDDSGVYFYQPTEVALDMLSFKTEETLTLLSELKISGLFDYVILDMDFGLDSDTLSIFRQCPVIVLVGDGSVISNSKLQRAVKALNLMEEDNADRLIPRMHLLFNKFSNKTGTVPAGLELKPLGGAPRYEHAKPEQIIQQIAALTVFDKILN